MNKPIFEWDEELGHASCIIEDKNNIFYGDAQCHDNDIDMKSQKTGFEIAYRRAKIQAFSHMRDYEIKPALFAYKQLYYSMNQSQYFNEKSYENKMLQRQIRNKQFDLDTINEIIATEKKMLREYLQEKDAFYKKIRENRHKDKNN